MLIDIFDGVDYAKAINRMEHSVCLEMLHRLGRSDGSIALVCVFLEERSMTDHRQIWSAFSSTTERQFSGQCSGVSSPLHYHAAPSLKPEKGPATDCLEWRALCFPLCQ